MLASLASVCIAVIMLATHNDFSYMARNFLGLNSPKALNASS